MGQFRPCQLMDSESYMFAFLWQEIDTTYFPAASSVFYFVDVITSIDLGKGSGQRVMDCNISMWRMTRRCDMLHATPHLCPGSLVWAQQSNHHSISSSYTIVNMDLLFNICFFSLFFKDSNYILYYIFFNFLKFFFICFLIYFCFAPWCVYSNVCSLSDSSIFVLIILWYFCLLLLLFHLNSDNSYFIFSCCLVILSVSSFICVLSLLQRIGWFLNF